MEEGLRHVNRFYLRYLTKSRLAEIIMASFLSPLFAQMPISGVDESTSRRKGPTDAKRRGAAAEGPRGRAERVQRLHAEKSLRRSGYTPRLLRRMRTTGIVKPGVEEAARAPHRICSNSHFGAAVPPSTTRLPDAPSPIRGRCCKPDRQPDLSSGLHRTHSPRLRQEAA